jgi:hypothetical protein
LIIILQALPGIVSPGIWDLNGEKSLMKGEINVRV